MKYKIILGLLLLSLILSVTFVLGKNPAFCTTEGGCNVVKSSEYAYTFGINNGYYGIIIFALLSTILFLQIRKPSNGKRIILNLSLLIGSLIALRFIYIQAFVLGSYCTACIIIDTSLLISAALIIHKEMVDKKWK